jgi:hypothetical protein
VSVPGRPISRSVRMGWLVTTRLLQTTGSKFQLENECAALYALIDVGFLFKKRWHKCHKIGSGEDDAIDAVVNLKLQLSRCNQSSRCFNNAHLIEFNVALITSTPLRMALGPDNLCIIFILHKNFFVRKTGRRGGRVVDLIFTNYLCHLDHGFLFLLCKAKKWLIKHDYN